MHIPIITPRSTYIPAWLTLSVTLFMVPAGYGLYSTEPVLVKDVNTVISGSMFLPAGRTVEPPVEMGGYVYFPADDGYHGRELWRTDGTLEGTTIVRDINPGRPDAALYIPDFMLTKAGESLFFRASDGVSDTELWTSDGTEEGTRMVRDVAPGSAVSAVCSPSKRNAL